MASAVDWRPQADWETLRLRAWLLASIRAFFAARGVLEVDTPALSGAAVTDPYLACFVTHYAGPRADGDSARYLQPSPEFPMKRLLAAGGGSIYQLAKVFRNGEAGRWHNPEFTLLEWYRVGFDHHRLMDEVAELAILLLRDGIALQPMEKLSYAEVFQRWLGLDPHAASVAELAACADRQGIAAPPGMPADRPAPWLDLLLSHCIEPRLGQGRLTFIYDYPAAQAALARVRPGEPAIAERFELYLNGVELANGFHELNDADEQRRRFQQDNRLRAALGLPIMPLDERLLAALAAGLPACSGVALGFDRLLALAAGKTGVRDALAFPWERA